MGDGTLGFVVAVEDGIDVVMSTEVKIKKNTANENVFYAKDTQYLSTQF